MENETRELLRKLSNEAKMLYGHENTEDDPNKNKKNDIMITLAEYPDIILTKKTSRQTKHLIVMPSAGAVFFKYESGDKDETIPFTPEEYSKFFSGSSDITVPDGFWTKKFVKGIEFGRQINHIFSKKEVLEMICKRCFPESVDLLQIPSAYSRQKYAVYLAAYSKFPIIYREFKDDTKCLNFMLSCPIFLAVLIEKFGLESTRDFMNEYKISLADFSNTHKNDGLLRSMYVNYAFEPTFKDQFANDGKYPYIPRIPLNYNSFKNYVLYDSISMGYRRNIDVFFEDWFDTLHMEVLIYKKIKEKYPKNLPTLHNILSDKQELMKQEIDEQKFLMSSERAGMYEGEYEGFVFLAPKEKQDFFDEAAMQANCLASYVSRFTEGNELIIFMRKKEDPERSYITIAICNGEVTQAKLAANKNPSTKEMSIIYSWVDKCNKKICSE